MTDVRELTLHGSGLLTSTKWVYDEDKGEGEYVVTPIKDNKHTLFTQLDKKIHFEPDVKFGSLLCALHDNPLSDPSMYNLLWNNACVKEAIEYFKLTNLDFTPHSLTERDAVEYLEVYRMWTRDSETDVVEYPIAIPSFHGKGIIQSDGYVTNYCMSYADPKTMYDIPLRLNTRGEFIEGNYDLWEAAYHANDKKDVPPLFTFDAAYTLREVIGAIFWEMSWNDSYHAKLRKANV